MKKHNIIIVCLLAVILLLIVQNIQVREKSKVLENINNLVKNENALIEKEKAVTEEHNSSVEKTNRTLRLYYDKYVAQLTIIKGYEDIINSLTDPFTADVKTKVRIPASDCYITVNDEKITIPPNGIIYVDEPEVTFGAYLHLNDWVFKDESLSRKLSYTFPHISNFFPAISYLSDHEISRAISLEKGERYLIEINDYGQQVFNIDSNEIAIIYDDTTLSGKDYMPNKSIELEYTGGFENEGFIEIYNYMDGYYEYRNEQFAAFSYDGIIQLINGAVVLTEIDSPDLEGISKLHAVLLPEQVKLHEKWMNNESILEITAIDVLIEVPYGKYKCIEVTTTNADYSYTKYYAQGLGIVKVDFNGMIEELIDIRIK